MTRFTVGKRVVTSTPSVTVDAGLRPGRHLFQLEVVTSNRRTSPPDLVVVEVTEDRAPAGPGGGRVRPGGARRPGGRTRPTRPRRPPKPE